MSAQDLYETIVETTGALIIVLDPEGRIVRFNPACERVSGYRFDEVRGRTVWEFLLTPEERKPAKAVFEDLRSGHFPNTFQNHWVTKSGALRFIEWSNSAVTDASGKVALIVGTGIDVTEKRAAEKALRESEARLQALSNNALDITAIVAEDKTIRFITPSVKRILGYSPEDLIGRSCFGICHPEDTEAAEAAFQRAIAHPAQVAEVTRRLRHRDGSWVYLESFWTSLLDNPQVQGVVVTSRDVTARRTAEARVHESEERFQQLAAAVPLVFWIKEAQSDRVLYVSPAFETIWGRRLPDPDSAFEVFRQSIHPDDREAVFRQLQNETVGDAPGETEYRIIRPDGTVRWIQSRAFPVRDERGTRRRIVGYAEDITDRKTIEQALSAARQRQKALFDNIPDVAWIKDADGRYVEVNPKFRERYGPDLPDPRGKSPEEIFPAEIAADMAASDRVVLESGQQIHVERQRVIRGEARWIDVTKFPIADSSGRIVAIAGITRDITDRKLAEAQRIARDAAQRDALVKEVHHRIKNNLQGVITLIQQLATQHPESAGVLEAAVTRLDSIASVYGLLGATGERELRLEQIVLNLVSSLKSLHADLPVRFTVRNPTSARVREIEIVPLALIVNELIMNAIKHSRATTDGKPIDVLLEGIDDRARIVIRNPGGRLPRRFNFDAGAGLGTGLLLVKSLLPPDGARLLFESTADAAGVKVELILSPPVITLSPLNVSSPLTAWELKLGAHSDR